MSGGRHQATPELVDGVGLHGAGFAIGVGDGLQHVHQLELLASFERAAQHGDEFVGDRSEDAGLVGQGPGLRVGRLDVRDAQRLLHEADDAILLGCRHVGAAAQELKHQDRRGEPRVFDPLQPRAEDGARGVARPAAQTARVLVDLLDHLDRETEPPDPEGDAAEHGQECDQVGQERSSVRFPVSARHGARLLNPGMLAQVEPFHTIEISRLAHELKAAGRSIIHMEFGQPSTGAPRGAIEAAHRMLDTDAMGYWESAALRAAIARRYRDVYAVDVEAERILLTAGASPALVLALSSLFKPGDRVALARPGYVAYRNVLRGLHLEPVEIGCGPRTRYQLDAAHLAALDPAPAGVIVASPANPTGTIIPADELRAIADICRARGIRIVSDEIYHGLSYGEPAHSMLEFEPTSTIVNSFSKYFSMPGWRLGWMVSPPGGEERARAYCANFFLTAPSLSQHAGLAAMGCAAELDANIETYRGNRARMLAAMPRLGLSSIAPPDGAFYIYADVGHLTRDSLGLARDLLRDTGVATAPGVDFDPVDGHRHLRFSFAVSTPQIEDALERMAPWFADFGALSPNG